MEGRERQETQKKKGKGGHPIGLRAGKQLLAIIRLAHTTHCPEYIGLSVNPTVRCFLTTCSLPADEAALIVVRLYTSPPAGPRWDG
jgi:hypothetical protein